MSNNQGFTLLELILVTVIIGILAGMVTLSFVGRAEEARIQRARADLVSYQNAIDAFALDHNDRFPKSIKELMGGKRDYVREIKPDPWGRPYIYQLPGKHRKNSYDISSAGPDGIAGNADDITSWSDKPPELESK